MQEDFLHYLWRFKKFDFINAKTAKGLPVLIKQVGNPNYNSGPDFFNAKIRIGEQLWAGNVEIHVKSSEWYAHNHQADPNYDNVILHVVWEHDVDIFRENNSELPVLELKNLIAPEILSNYRKLLLAPNDKWVNCESDFANFTNFEFYNWLERVYFEKLQQKSVVITDLLQSSGNNWEETLFKLLCKNFGLNVNGTAFMGLAQSVDFKIIQKISGFPKKLEALFLGQTGMLEPAGQEVYFQELKEEYKYLCRKYALDNTYLERPKFFRLRPDNFPNIRLSQLAGLYSQHPHLFSEIMKAGGKKELAGLFKISASKYWQEHYTFGKPHKKRKKEISDNFIDLLIINTILPLKFCYLQKAGTGNFSEILGILENIDPEENSIVKGFQKLRPTCAENALHSQALLYLKKFYCDKNACLNCNLGAKVLQGKM